MPLVPMSFQQTWQIIFPVLQAQITRIATDQSSSYIGFKAEYEEGKLPFISPILKQQILLKVTNVRSIGDGDDRNYYTDHPPTPEYPDGYKTPTYMQSELKAITLSVIVHSFELTDEWNAWNTINNIYNRIYWNSVTDALSEVNCGILKRFPPNNISFNFKGRLVNAMQMDFEITTSTNDIDTESSNWIDTIGLSGELTSSSGEIINIPEENIP